ncbi:uncharacterized protein [Mytilus edulis]|uniref:uncharacterized protein n=1 Tax=Mytilus edulis TaxID=6550 RepID=UPI0039EE65DD
MGDGSDLRLSASVLILATASIFYIIGFSTNYFVTTEVLIIKTNSGLWAECGNILGETCCATINSYAGKDWFIIVRAMCILGLVAIVTSTFCVGLRLIKHPENKILRIATIVATFSAVVFILIGLAVYSRNTDEITAKQYFEYGYSFGFCATGMCFAILVDFILLVDLCMTKNNIRSRVDVEKKQGQKANIEKP